MNPIHSLLALWKRLLSYRKETWTLDDYPIRVQRQNIEPTPGSRLQPILWSAQIINGWQVHGMGATREEAIADLRVKLENYRETHTLPRPGDSFPIEYASSARVDAHADLARDFLKRIFDVDYDDCFISDESSLWDFHGEESNAELERKIAILYGVDISDLEGAKLADIFTRIAARR